MSQNEISRSLSSDYLKYSEDDLKNQHILVIGDLMLDVYHWGNIERISPEAPVPVVDVEISSQRLGGAANVCANIVSLGTKCSVCGLIGNDEDGATLRSQLEKQGINTQALVETSDRPTTRKMRIIASNQHVVRVDWENTDPISKEIESQLESKVSELLRDKIDAIILQDYNKGLFSKKFISSIISFASTNNIPVFVDPKFSNFWEYKNSFLFKPNRKEASEILAQDLNSIENVQSAAKELKQKLGSKNILITLGEKGMLLLTENDEFVHIPTEARKVHDVSGAGDTVISTLAVFYSAGYSLEKSANLANISAGRICEEVGIVPINHTKLKTFIETYF